MADIIYGMKLALLATAAAYALWFFAPSWAEQPFNAAAVTCFPMPSIKGRVPAVQSELMKLENAPSDTEQKRASMQSYQASVREAEANCTKERCEPAALKKYRGSISSYLFVRENTTRNLYRERGEGGLDYAAEIFNTGADTEVVDNLRAFVNAGVIDLAKLGKVKQTAALLVLKRTTDYRPCAEEDAASIAEGKAGSG